MPQDLRLLAATSDDCAALSGLARLAHSAHGSAWNEQQFRDSLREGHQCWLLRSAEGEIIASCVISQVFDEAEILDIAVAPQWRRQGLAEALLDQVIAQLPAEIARVLLEVRVSNHPARALYKKLGFEADGSRKNYYPLADGGREDAILMSLLR
jgi:ribosomal-protein-alanine N-acetyltransferase